MGSESAALSPAQILIDRLAANAKEARHLRLFLPRMGPPLETGKHIIILRILQPVLTILLPMLPQITMEVLQNMRWSRMDLFSPILVILTSLTVKICGILVVDC